MTRARDIANLVDANGDIVAGALDNVPPADLVNDTTPQLGGALDAQSNNITSVGNLGIGTASPTSSSGGKLLAIETAADEHTNLVFNTANTGRNGIIEGRRTGRSGSERFAQINIQNNSDDGEIRFYTAPSGSDVSERMRIDADGNVTKPNHPAFDVASSQGVSGGNYQTFNFVYLNQGSHFGSNKFTAPIDGIYQFFATTIKSGHDTSGVTRVYIRVNGSATRGSRHVRLSEGSAYGTNGVGSWVLNLSANDYVQMYIADNGSHNSIEYTYFNGYLIG